MDRPEKQSGKNNRKRDSCKTFCHPVDVTPENHLLCQGSSHTGHHHHQDEDKWIRARLKQGDDLLFPVTLDKLSNPLGVSLPIIKKSHYPFQA